MESRRAFAPVHRCPICDAPVDPLQVATEEGVCGRLACRAEASRREASARSRAESARTAEARRRLADAGIDPTATPWATVPANDAVEVPLDQARRREFLRQLERVVAELREAGAGEPPPPPGPDRPGEGEAVARACAACRGWCCRRGGTHAFLDAWSVSRVLREHPDLTEAELPALYARHLAASHLEGGCVFQGPAGCRLPRSLRSDTCNGWLCEDLTEARREWRRTGTDPARVRFVAVARGAAPDRSG